MKILHYTLGFAPERSGGLVKYVSDLMESQMKNGHSVIALFPGKINLIKRSTRIKRAYKKDVIAYQIINSLPLAIFGGIKSPEDFMKDVDEEIYLDFLNKVSPDIVHVHTLMGIHKEFFLAIKKKKIPIVYTSHDYYGLSPEPNFFYNGSSYDESNSSLDWFNASKEALDTKILRVFQFSFYPMIRSLLYVNKKYIHNTVRDKTTKKNISTNSKKYIKLKKYYQEIFKMIDKFHFNSSLAKEVFLENIKDTIDYEVISITNSNVSQKNISRNFSHKIRIAYIGPDKEYKGFYDFVSLSNEMAYFEKFEFHTYGYIPKEKFPNLIQHGKYNWDEIYNVYENIDILVVPSKWKETFGLIVLEAMSFGTLTFVSENVGAKDLVRKQQIFTSIKQLIDKILDTSNEDYIFNKKIVIKDLEFHTKEILDFYLGVIENI